jgi:hypothetical protein
MSRPKKPRLDWIAKVLAEPGAARAPATRAPLRLVWGAATPAVRGAAADERPAHSGSDRPPPKPRA